MFKHSLWKNVCHVVGQEWEAGAPFSISYCVLYNLGSGHNRSLPKTTIVSVHRYWWHFLTAHKDQSNVLTFSARAKYYPPFVVSLVRSEKLPSLFRLLWWHWKENLAHRFQIFVLLASLAFKLDQFHVLPWRKPCIVYVTDWKWSIQK